MPSLAVVNMGAGPNTGNTSGQNLRFQKKPSLANNGIIVGVEVDGNVTLGSITVSDDKTNTWSSGASFDDVTHGTQFKFFFCLAPATGTSRINIDFGGATSSFIAGIHAEFCGLAASGSSVNAAGATSGAGPGNIQPGSFTPANAGDLILQWAHDATNWPASGITSWTKGAGFTKLSANKIDGMVCQWRAAAGGATNPIVTVGGSTDQFLTVAMSLPADSSRGTLPTGSYVVGTHHFGIAQTDADNPLVLDVPAKGNCIVVQSDMFRTAAPSVCNVTSITDNKNAGNMTQAGTAVTNTSLGQSQGFYRTGATTDDGLILTVNLDNAQDSGSTIVVSDVVCGTFDTFANATGNQTSPGNVTGAPLITPAQPNGVLIGHLSVNSHAIGTPGSVDPLIFDAWVADTMDGGGSQGDQDNGYGEAYPTGTSQFSFDWTTQHNTAGVNTWAAKAMSFNPLVVTAPPQLGRNLYVMP